jgi:TonB family protein
MRALPLLVALMAAPAAAQQSAPDSTRVYDLGAVEVLPRPQNVAEFTAALHQAYPPHLRQAGVGGTVHVAFVVGTDGQPRDVRVVSTPDSAFGAPSAQAISLLRFSPAQVQGQPVAVRVEQPITWRTEAPPPAAVPVAPADSIQVYALEDVEVRPMPENFSEFQAALRKLYPRELRDAHPQAEVIVRFVIDLSGQVRYPRVLQSSDARFDSVSLEAVRRLRFQPAVREGALVWVWMDVPVEWGEPQPAPPAEIVHGDAEQGYELSEVDELPRPLNITQFERMLSGLYPPRLRAARDSGIVQVRFRVEVDGTTSNYTVTRSTHNGFNEASLEAVRLLVFRPGVEGGRPVRVWVELPIHWKVGREREEELFPAPDRPMFGMPAPARRRTQP